MSAQLCRALYDNTAECLDELSFRKGDLMVLLQPEAPGLEGWHLCSLHGQQGIVPANRVKVLAEPGSPGPVPHRKHAPADVYQVPRKEAAALVGKTYEVPQDELRRRGLRQEEQEVYEVPPPARPCPLPPEGIYRVPRGVRRDGDPTEVYDVPSALLRESPVDTYDSPSPCPKKVARVAPQPMLPPPAGDPYDVPLAFKKPSAAGQEEEEGEEEEGSERPLVYATPSNLRRASALLNLYESPEEVLGGGQGEQQEEEDEDGGIYDIPLLPPGSPPLEGALQGLSLRDPGPPSRPRLPSAESLSRRPLPALPSEERLSVEPPQPSPSIVRKGSIQDRPLPPPPPRLGGLGAEDQLESVRDEGYNEYEGIRLAEEYDYVHLKGADKSQPKPSTPEGTPGPALPGDTAQTEEQVPPSPEDSQLLQFYTGQCQTHYSTLLSAIEALLASAGANQPPRVFVPHGKFVIVTAHKLVFVGDTVSRLASSATVRARVGAASGALCQALKEAVLSVKGAALRYPSLPAAREMRECVAELSRRALAFTSLLATLAPS
ncbi:PREDICTED: embryonal Fyn-associated substrate isoform X2 [Gekko japonicus]|uniref:Embryonal Fyn-associated substrate isoform X2 n=1 Tax=Gekko japonicus TaxID=146911 RepID=A0ABM1JI18_GEKJA|nr:PREDICTED: embryonal Fyn-associated substrate isoform X2 [Gekko japonicus]